MAMRLIKIHKPPIFLAKHGGASQLKQHDNDNGNASPGNSSEGMHRNQ